MGQTAATLLWIGRYAGGGLVAFVTPRLLVAMGVPLDEWIAEAGRAMSIHIDREVALWLAAFIVAAVLYVGSVVLSKDHSWKPEIPDIIKRRWRNMEPLHLITTGAAVIAIGLVLVFAGAWRFTPKVSSGSEKPKQVAVKTDPSDIPKKLAIVDSVLLLLRGDAENLIDKGMQLATGWKNPLAAHDMKVWQPYRIEVANWKTDYERMFNGLDNTRQEESRFADIETLLGQPFRPIFDLKMNRFHGAVGSTSENPQGLTYVFFMEPIAEEFYAQLQVLQSWRRETISRAVALRKTLSE